MQQQLQFSEVPCQQISFLQPKIYYQNQQLVQQVTQTKIIQIPPKQQYVAQQAQKLNILTKNQILLIKKDPQIQYTYYQLCSNSIHQKKQEFVQCPDQSSLIESLKLENQNLMGQKIMLIYQNEKLHNLIDQLNNYIVNLQEQQKKEEQNFQDKLREQEQSIFYKLNQLTYQENDDKGQNLLIKHIKEKMQLLYPPLPFSLIVGKPGVGKTSIMKVLFDRKPTQEFKPEYLKELNSYFVDTKAFDMNSSYQIKQEQKKLYQQLFTTYPDKIANIFIVVNYERTDIMKQKISEIITKFNKFLKMVSIIITNFDESEDPEADEIELRQNLEYFKTKEIIFIKRNTKKEEMIQKLQKVMVQQNKDQIYPFDLKDTIFEILNPEELQQIMADIFQNIKL